MEEKDDIIYDLEAKAAEGEESTATREGAENMEQRETPEANENAENAEDQEKAADCGNPGAGDIPAGTENPDISERAEGPEETDPARSEIERMVGEMGAETLLEIIRDNRNAAIRQILSEVETTRRRDLPSGASSGRRCTSIFDLAALA